MKKVIRLTESDLIKLVKRIVKENEEEYLYHHPASMGSGKWLRNTFHKGEAEEYSDDELDIEDLSIDDVDDDVIAPRFREFYKKASPTIKRAKLKKRP